MVNIRAARAYLSRLIARAAKGGQMVIARAGKPLVRRVAVEAPEAPRHLGFMEGEIAVPDDFDRMGQTEIESLFGAGG